MSIYLRSERSQLWSSLGGTPVVKENRLFCKCTRTPTEPVGNLDLAGDCSR